MNKLNKGFSMPIVALLGILFFIFALSITKLITSESILNVTKKKSNQARQNAIAGVERSIAHLRYTLQETWLTPAQFLKKIEPIENSPNFRAIELTDTDLKDYYETISDPADKTLIDLLVDCCYDPAKLPRDPSLFKKITSTSAEMYLSEPGVYSSTITVYATHPSTLTFTAGFGLNTGEIKFTFDIFSEGYSPHADNKSTNSVHARATVPLTIPFTRESFAKYALFTETNLKDTNPALPLQDMHPFWATTDVDNPMVVFSGPVFCGGDMIIRNAPVFEKTVKLLAGKRIYVYDIDDDLKPPEPIDFFIGRRNTCFPQGITYLSDVPALDSSVNSVSHLKFVQSYIRGLILDEGTFKKKSAEDMTVYAINNRRSGILQPISLQIDHANNERDLQIQIVRAPHNSNETITVPTDTQLVLAFITTELIITGCELPKNGRITVSAFSGNADTKCDIFLEDSVRYSDTVNSSNDFSNTVIGLIAWLGDIVFRPDITSSKDKTPLTNILYLPPREYNFDGVYFARGDTLNNSALKNLGVFRLNAPDGIADNYKRPDDSGQENRLLGTINFFGSRILKHNFGLKQIENYIEYGFDVVNRYDLTLEFQKSPPFFPSSGAYYVHPNNPLTVSDGYRIIRK